VLVMKLTRIIKVLNILIVVTSILALGVTGALLMNVASLIPTVNVGEPVINVSGLTAAINIPLKMSNPGPFPLTGISLVVSVEDVYGVKVLEGSLGPIDIPASAKNIELTVKAVFDISKIPRETLERLLRSSESLVIKARIEGAVPPLVNVLGTFSTPFYWGAPIKDLSIGKPIVSPHNLTHVVIEVPISFKDDSQFIPVSGVGIVRVFNEEGAEVGLGELVINVPPKGSFKASLKVLMSLPKNIEQLLFNDTELRYRAVAEFQSGNLRVPVMEHVITIYWGAPLRDLAVINPRIEPYNNTHARVLVDASFTNNNEYLSIDSKVIARVFNATSGAELGLGEINIKAAPKTTFKGSLISYVKVSPDDIKTLLFNDRELRFRIELVGVYAGMEFKLDRYLNIMWGAPFYGLSLGKPVINNFSIDGVEVFIPLAFENHSPWINISVPLELTIYNKTSGEVIGSGEAVIVASPNAKVTEVIPVTLRIPSETLKSLLFNDKVVELNAKLVGSYYGLKFEVEKFLEYEWRAPLANLKVGEPLLNTHNITHLTAIIPLAFENHSPFNLSIVITSDVFNLTSNELVGSSELLATALSGRSFSGNLSTYISLRNVNAETLFFKDVDLKYNVVLNVGVSGLSVSSSREVSLTWGAPIKDLRLGSPEIKPYNSTHAVIEVPVSFTDNSDFISVKGELLAEVYDSKGNYVGTSVPLILDVRPKTTYSGVIKSFVGIDLLTEEGFMFKLIFKTDYGVLEREVVLHA